MLICMCREWETWLQHACSACIHSLEGGRELPIGWKNIDPPVNVSLEKGQNVRVKYSSRWYNALWSLHGKNNQKISAINNATIKVDYHVVIVTKDDLTQTSTAPSVINGV